MRNGSSNPASYPFGAAFAGAYEFLPLATDAEFVTIVLGMTVFWIALGAASLLVDRSSAMRCLLWVSAAIDLLCALVTGANPGTAALDAAFIAMVHIVGKKQNHASSGLQSGPRFSMRASEKSCD